MCKWFCKCEPKKDDDFVYDLEIPMPESKELDFVYTSDIHVGWKNFGSSRWGEDFKIFSLDKDQLTGKKLAGGDVKAYQNRLIEKGIPAYLLDCGDWSMSAGESDEDREHAISVMQQMDYFGITSGNWEFKWKPISKAFKMIDKMKDYNFLSINLCGKNNLPLYQGGINPDLPGCRTIKVGDKKIAVIGISYPSPNGFSTYGDNVEYNGATQRWNYKEGGETVYRYKDSVNNSDDQLKKRVDLNASGSLYGILQNYINKLKGEYGFDIVIAFGHMDRWYDEDYDADGRFYSRADLLIKNTDGLDAFIPGHLNSPLPKTLVYTHRTDGKLGVVAPMCGGTLNSFGRLRINFEDNDINGELIQSIKDLKKI